MNGGKLHENEFVNIELDLLKEVQSTQEKNISSIMTGASIGKYVKVQM